ncbi:MAG: hypothetical protein ABI024_13570 [Vicinamibacterales bacterium]
MHGAAVRHRYAGRAETAVPREFQTAGAAGAVYSHRVGRGRDDRASESRYSCCGVEREQRRMRAFERFIPSPVDPMLHGRILDMEKDITGVWTRYS